MTEAAENGQGMLLQFFLDWQAADQRAAMARQTLLGAESDAVVKEARFKGAAELVYGPDASFEYSPDKGLRFMPPNRATRRELAKARRKKVSA